VSQNNAWKTLKEKVIYTTPWCRLTEETVQLPDGVVIDNYSLVELNDVVMILPVTDKKEVIMERQYRHGVRKTLLELPAGTYDAKKEKPEDAIRRELLEETGYKIKNLRYLGKIYEYPTKEKHSINIYLGTSLIYEPINFKEATENIEIVKVPWEKIESMIENGEIQVSGTIAAIHLAEKYLK